MSIIIALEKVFKEFFFCFNVSFVNLEEMNDATWDLITCKFNDDVHFLEDPVVLDCKNIVCLSCVLKLSDRNSIIECKICYEKHNLENNLNFDRSLGKRVKYLLENHKSEIVAFAKKILLLKYDKVNGNLFLLFYLYYLYYFCFIEKCSNFNEKFELQKNKLENVIENRINVLKDCNDNLYKECIDTIKNYKKIVVE